MVDFKSPFKSRTFVLPLIEGDRIDVLNKVPIACTLRFVIPPRLHGSTLQLETNHPPSATAKFERNNLRKLAFTRLTWDDENYAEIQIVTNGTFIYRFENNRGQSGSGYFIVDPVLRVQDNVINLNSLTVQTVLMKSLGPLKEWQARLQPTLECNYNALHFTPIQRLGASNSSYSIMNQLEPNPTIKASMQEIGQFIQHLKDDHEVLSFCDLVYNHTANETPWLMTHPEATYNLLNSPHLRPAYLLDAALQKLSREIARDQWENYGVPKEFNKEEHLEALKKIIYTHVLPAIKLEQLYMLDTEDTVQAFKARACRLQPRDVPSDGELVIIQDPEYRRFSSMIDWNLAINIFHINRGSSDAGENLQRSAEALRAALINLNESQEKLIWNHVNAAVDNVLSAVRYERIDSSGPRLSTIDDHHPLVGRYFERIQGPSSLNDLALEEQYAWSEGGRFIMAHNGWVMGDDPLQNFAAPKSNVYLRRELIAWGDSVKLRYGESPSDSPFLWKLMREYTEQTASIFHGIRLDNCHSTPIHVAEYMMDAARNVRPNIYVFAELFTNSDKVDNIFVNRLGITSLIREAMNAWSPHELGRLVFRYGGAPIGSFMKTGTDVVQSTVAHALFMDQTHDNPSLVEKRSLFDCLPTAALVAMTCSATGSNRGFDELVPHHIHVVNETRLYSSISNGICSAKSFLNDLHIKLGSGYNQNFIDQHTSDVVVVTRHAEASGENVILIAYSSFTYPPEEGGSSPVRTLNIGVTEVTSILYEARLISKTGCPYARPEKLVTNPDFINGLDGYTLMASENLEPGKARFIRVSKNCQDTLIDFVDFHPGDIVILKTQPPSSSVQAIQNLEHLLKDDTTARLLNSLKLGDLNKILYRCENEERDDSDGNCGVYVIPNHGPLVYSGLQGVASLLSEIRVNDDLGHPLCCNLRAGNWLLDYIVNRLLREDSTREVGLYLKTAFQYVKDLPRNLIPRFFDIVVMVVTLRASNKVWELMNEFVQSGSPFVKQLSLATLQVTGHCKSGYLPGAKDTVSLSAGLPHFSTGYMRNWGRDTFIALPGVYLVTGRYEEAKQTILAYASVMRHGLIPNLLDKGTHARYNCRDATWFWLYAIVRYCQLVPGGEAILKEKVSRMYPNDLSLPVLDDSVVEVLEDTVYEALLRHVQGIKFRERNAGQSIDAHMRDEGFNVEIRVDTNTGFVCGGNRFNCGTWMDKMGSSEKAGNKGLPATPRDGADVEIVGLSFAVLKFLDFSYKSGVFRYDAVANSSGLRWTWSQWQDTIKNNFEPFFWIDEEDQNEYIHRRCIYKDTVGSSLGYTDFQLRPNFVIAMAVADELFTTNRALKALEKFRELLLGPLGAVTLDPADWNYNGFYDNSNDSSDMKVAHGWNYHNGPEWVWPIGFYLRSYVHIMSRNGERSAALTHVKEVLSNHIQHINISPWRGLPELTNKNGATCPGSCPTQAWSMATLLETLHDVQTTSN